MMGAEVTKVLRVANPQLWCAYMKKKARIGPIQHSSLDLQVTSAMATLHHSAFSKPPAQLGAVSRIHLDPEYNEVLLFHGTSTENAERIASTGFDLTRVRNGLYGAGFYFAYEACKSSQYSTPAAVDGSYVRCIVVARVCLGRYRCTETDLSGGKAEILTRGEDSIVVLPGTLGGPGGQHHHEFVIFEKEQAFPEFIVYFKVNWQ